MHKNSSIKALIFTLAAIFFLPSCSTRKNTAASRFYQAFTTRYNVYFNGSEHYKEQIKALENDYEDDYTTILFTHPAQAFANERAPQPGTNFDRTIEKMQKAIQLHSIKKRPKKKSGKMRDPKYRAYLKRDEYNPFIHNAWLLMAKAQYMNGAFTDAASTFHYITKHFTWFPNLVTECKLWEARCYTAEGWLNEADNILVRIKKEEVAKEPLYSLYNLAYADYHIKSKHHAEAIPYLRIAAKKAGSSGQKTRLNFLLGQMYGETGDKAAAYQAFKKAGNNSNATYRTKFNARIKQSEVYSGNNIEKEVKSLKRMVRYDRNKEYLDQVYYAIGNLYLIHQDTLKAIENYKLAIEKSTRGGIEKAIAQITLGSLYFDMSNYADAQPNYSEAISQLKDDYPNYETLKKRSDVLDELAVYSQNVILQDSLLKLAKLTPEEQEKVAQRLVDELKKKEKEEAEAAAREEFLAEQQAQGNQFKDNNKAPTTFQMPGSDNSWYFYNSAAKNAGKTAFQRQWGNRKLEDNWRRRNKASFSFDDFESDENNENENELTAEDSTPTEETDSVSSEDQKKLDDPHYVEYYLKQIPKTPEEIQTCHDIIQEGLFNMGVILKDKLEDFHAAVVQFTRLLNEYPDNIYRLDTYYNMYLMYMRTGDIAMSEKYRKLITSEFADSKFGIAMQDPNYIENLRNMERDQEGMYEKAYAAYLDNDNKTVHEAYMEMMRKYPLSKIMPKFMFIDALSYLTDKNYDKFKSTLKEMLERYPETDITPTASSILKQMAKGRKLEGGSTNVRGMVWSMRLTNDTTDVAGGKLTPFEDDINKPQYFVLVFDTDSIPMNQLLFDVAKHNFTSFVTKDFDLEPMNFGRLGLVVVKGFANVEEVGHYRKVFDADDELNIPKQVKQVVISVNNFKILLNEGRSFEEYFSFIEQKAAEKLEAETLGEEDAENSESSTPGEDSTDESQTANDDRGNASSDTDTPAQPSAAPSDTSTVNP